MDYLIGWKPFLDCRIFLDSRPMIPANETEYWVEQALSEIRPDASILDLFAGSGAIGVAILKHLPETRVDFGELDAAHFPTIRKNIHENGIDEARTNVIQTDVWSGINGTYDYVLTNPPYVARERIERVEPTVLDYEPHLALFAEEEGFALIRRTVEGAREHLNPGGVIYIEHEPEHAEAIAALAKEKRFSVETRPDQYNVSRYSVLKLLSNS